MQGELAELLDVHSALHVVFVQPLHCIDQAGNHRNVDVVVRRLPFLFAVGLALCLADFGHDR